MIIFYSLYPWTLTQLPQINQQNFYFQNNELQLSNISSTIDGSSLKTTKNTYEQCLANELKLHKQRKQKKIWTQKQDQFLENAREQGNDWDQISYAFGIPPMRCKQRYRLLRKQRVRWPKGTDNYIKQLFEELGTNWPSIARRVNQTYKNKTKYNPKQIKERYLFHLKPGISRQQWTEEEDLLLLDQIGQRGRVWRSIAQFFPNRTELQLKNRYYGTLKHVQAKTLRKLQEKTSHSELPLSLTQNIVFNSINQLAPSG